jgi:hypothetical protein
LRRFKEDKNMFTFTPEKINEETARRAKEMISFSDYQKGSATAEYTSQVNEVVKMAEELAQRSRFITDEPERMQEAQRYIDYYSRKYAEYINKDNEITCRCPSVMVAGPANFPVRKKQKQVAAWDANRQNYISLEDARRRLYYILVEEHPISGSDPDAVEKLTKKLNRLQVEHAEHLKANKLAKAEVKAGRAKYAYGTFGAVTTEDGRTLPTYFTDNESAEIRRVKARIEQLEKAKAQPSKEESGEGWNLYEDQEAGRICFEFDGKPEQDIINSLKVNGFRWSPRLKRWQRQNTDNGRRAADRVRILLTA